MLHCKIIAVMSSTSQVIATVRADSRMLSDERSIPSSLVNLCLGLVKCMYTVY